MNKGQRTANRILDVAEELFARHGYEGTALRDIAERAAIQQPGLYKHFASKDDLYRRVYERALGPLFALMDELLEADGNEAARDNGVPAELVIDDLAARLTDLLALHPNIANLLVRAAMNPAPQTDRIAIDWLERLVSYGHRLAEKAGGPADRRVLAVQVVAVFNTLFGYFSAMPLIRQLAGSPEGAPDETDRVLLESQKKLLRQMIASFRNS